MSCSEDVITTIITTVMAMEVLTVLTDMEIQVFTEVIQDTVTDTAAISKNNQTTRFYNKQKLT